MFITPVGAMQTMLVLCSVAQLCLTLCDLMDCSFPGSSVHGDSPGKNTGVDSDCRLYYINGASQSISVSLSPFIPLVP